MGRGPLRVLIVLSSNARRGSEIEGERLGRELAAEGLEVQTVALAPRPALSEPLKVDVLGPRPLSFTGLRKLRRAARKVDVVVAYGSKSLPACAIALGGTHRPFVYRSIGNPGDWLRGQVHRWRTGLMLRRARRIVTLWDQASDAMQQLYGIAASDITSIPNARDPEEFRVPSAAARSHARDALGIGHDDLVVAAIGALSPEKRIDLTIHATARCRGARLVIAGEGPLRSELERLGAEVLGPRVTFMGALTDVRPVLTAADVVVLASRTEGMPGVALEAGLMNLPIAGCEVGAIRWLFDRGLGGTLVPMQCNADELAGAIRSAVGRPPNRQELIATCSWGAVTAQWISCLEEAATSRKSARRSRGHSH